jgi:hypothetical protein
MRRRHRGGQHGFPARREDTPAIPFSKMAHPQGPFVADPFDHRQHLRFAWTVLSEVSTDEAESIVTDEISRFAAIHAPGRYHDTITRFWVRLVAHTRAVDLDATFDDHLDRFPILSDKHARWYHYSDEVLARSSTRAAFVSPDHRALP